MANPIFGKFGGLTVISQVTVIRMGPPGTGGGGSGGTPSLHASTHAATGTDPITLGNLAQGTGTTGHVWTKTSSGASWQAPPTSSTAAHASTHNSGGTDALTVINLAPGTGTTGHVLTRTATGMTWQAPSSSGTSTPTAHASTHGSGGTDPITPASIGALPQTNATAANFSTTGHLMLRDVPLYFRQLADGSVDVNHRAAWVNLFGGVTVDGPMMIGFAGGGLGTTLGGTGEKTVLQWSSTGVNVFGNLTVGGTAVSLNGHGHAVATTTEAGFMSAADKTKLDGLGSGGSSTPTAHATTHSSGGTDAITVTNLATGTATTGHVLTKTASGMAWQAVATGSGGTATPYTRTTLNTVPAGVNRVVLDDGTPMVRDDNVIDPAATTVPAGKRKADQGRYYWDGSRGWSAPVPATPEMYTNVASTDSARLALALATGYVDLAFQGTYTLDTFLNVPTNCVVRMNGATIKLSTSFGYTNFGKHMVGTNNAVPLGYIINLGTGARIIGPGTVDGLLSTAMPLPASGGFLYAGIIAAHVNDVYVGGTAQGQVVVKNISLYGVLYHNTAGSIMERVKVLESRRVVGMRAARFETGSQSGGLALSSSRGWLRQNIIRDCEVDGIDEIGIDNRDGGSFNDVVNNTVRNVGRGLAGNRAPGIVAGGVYDVDLTDGVEPIGIQTYNGGHYGMVSGNHVSGMRRNVPENTSGSRGCWGISIDVLRGDLISDNTVVVDVDSCRIGIEFAQVVSGTVRGCNVIVKDTGSIPAPSGGAFVIDKTSSVSFIGCNVWNERTTQASTTDSTTGVVTRYTDHAQVQAGFLLKGVGVKGDDPRQLEDGNRATALGTYNISFQGCNVMGALFGIYQESTTANSFVSRVKVRDFRALVSIAGVEIHGGEWDIEGESNILIDQASTTREDVGAIKIQASNPNFKVNAKIRGVRLRCLQGGRAAVLNVSVTNVDTAVMPRPVFDIDECALEGISTSQYLIMSQGVGWGTSRIGHNLTETGTTATSDYYYYGGSTTPSTPLDRYKSGAFGAPNLIPGGFQWRTAAGVSYYKMGTVAPTTETDGTVG